METGEKVVTSAQFLIDSQASLTGSLERMEDMTGQEDMASMEHQPETRTEIEAPTMASHDMTYKSHGTLRLIIADENKVKISHAPIPALQWPSMTMDFSVATGVSLHGLKAGQMVDFHLRKIGEFEYEIAKIKAASMEKTP